ncbi:RND family efflux transporter, MFP subunit [Noviherbaspirillum humi]|uniref:RND family efflux transporter, MFP subunit n=1 Tax=Noviherbaspirillum humi TaxID=1688639 RepID=A0A239ECJ8_9BURK|nr:efflux RND transporter periplasmic adaptor subunit [Noviherbaspirillum humi]SNS42219.1 RND family efflux transporter, MFP subunit [Noviherbaspirillum humi]
MLKRRGTWIIIALALLLTGGGAAVMKKRQGAAQAAMPAAAPAPAALEFLPQDVAQAKRRDLRQILPLSGSLRAVNQASVKARVGGEVREVLVREGEPVKAGQVLVKMDATEYQARLDQARGALRAAEGQLDIAVKARDNNRTLMEKGFISKNAFENSASQFDIARANVASARGALDVAQKSLGDTVIKAPIGGIVSSRSVQPGEKVSPDNKLLDVVDLRQMELEAAVPAADILNVSLGQEVQLRIEGLAQPLPGKVARISPATQAGSRSILIYIQVDNPDGALRVGMFADARLTLARKAGVLTVPQSAVQSDAGSNYLYAIENGKLARKPVTLGARGDDGDGPAVEIASGLEDGATVVRTNLGNLQSGAPVRFARIGGQQREAAAPAAKAGAAQPQ